MIKKTISIILVIWLSFLLLEGIGYWQQKNRDASCQKPANNQVEIVDESFCPFEFKPYKNKIYDFISPELSTDFEIDENQADYAVIDDITVPQKIKKSKPIITTTQKPKIVIVIDDMGIAHQRTKDILEIKAPITVSFLTYSKKLSTYFKIAKENGHEIMAHIPMEAKKQTNVAPDCLLVSMSDKEIKKNLEKMLDKFDTITAINNHTGSLFTENSDKMSVILKVLKKRNLMFLDSKTSQKSIAKEKAEKYGVPYLSRNVFLDNENDFEYILKQLKQTEKIAKKKGYAIAIAHPKSQTILALKHWVANNKDFEVVPLSTISAFQ